MQCVICIRYVRKDGVWMYILYGCMYGVWCMVCAVCVPR